MTTSDNPYRAPSAPVADYREPEGDMAFAAPGATVDAGRGASWIGEGWALFKAAPAMWIVALLILGVIQGALGLVPVLGDIVSLLLGPIFMVGVLAFGHAIARGEPAEPGKLFVGFREKTGPLVAVAAIYLGLVLAVVLVCAIVAVVVLGGSQLLSVASAEAAMGQIFAGAGGLAVLVLVLVMLAGLMLVGAAYWYAPGLVFYANMDPWSATKASFSACLRNWLPFLVYSLLALVVVLGGMVALIIGFFLVSLPVLMASYYTSFRDIFGRKA
jgi:uncharacterized membrane protein